MALTFTEITKRMLTYRNPEQFVPGKIRTLKSVPYIGTKSIQHQALIKGQTNEYSTIVQFYDVEFVEEKVPGYIPVKVKLSTGDKLYYYKPPSLKKNPVALKCSSPDFRFRFEYALWKVKSLIGPFRKYKKVPGSTRPPVNPDDIPGYGKHIRTLVNSLLQAKMVVE